MSLLLLLNPHGTITPPSGGHPTADETALRALTLEVDEDVAKLVNLTRAGKHLYVTNHGPGVCYFTVGANGSVAEAVALADDTYPAAVGARTRVPTVGGVGVWVSIISDTANTSVSVDTHDQPLDHWGQRE